MKPIPAPSSHDDSGPESSHARASDLLKSSASNYSNTNRRSQQASVNRAYPILLLLSTSVAVFFGFMYMNKPVVIAGSETKDTTEQATAGSETNANSKPGLLPATDKLPGDDATDSTAKSAGIPTTAPIHSRYEETNMRVQHILTAKSEDGHVSRIDLEVPVLYQSRNLRWTPTEVVKAQELMVRLMDYQDKSRQLRLQGEQLLTDWNALISKSIPASRLRADSPSIPENQHHLLNAAGISDTTTRDAVEINTKGDQQ